MSKPNYDMTGILFKNDKEGNDQRPDYKGNITFNNVEFELAGWIRQGKKGNFMTLKVSEKRRRDVSGEVPDSENTHRSSEQARQPGANNRSGRTPPPDENFDDDIPF